MLALELQEVVNSMCADSRFLSLGSKMHTNPVVSHLLPHLIFYLKTPAGVPSWRLYKFPNHLI